MKNNWLSQLWAGEVTPEARIEAARHLAGGAHLLSIGTTAAQIATLIGREQVVAELRQRAIVSPRLLIRHVGDEAVISLPESMYGVQEIAGEQ